MYCSNCGNQVPDDTKTCPECGQDLSYENQHIQDQPKRYVKKTNRAVPVILAAMIALVAGTAMISLFFGTEESSSSDSTGGVTDLLTQSDAMTASEAETLEDLLNAEEPTPTATVTPIADLPEIQATIIETPTPTPTPEPTVTETPVPDAASGDYILPGSDTTAVTEAQLASMDAAQIRLARNEIYARHGLIFKSADLQAYFQSKTWYQGTVSSTSEIALNDVERSNIAFINAYERAHNYNQ